MFWFFFFPDFLANLRTLSYSLHFNLFCRGLGREREREQEASIKCLLCVEHGASCFSALIVAPGKEVVVFLSQIRKLRLGLAGILLMACLGPVGQKEELGDQ